MPAGTRLVVGSAAFLTDSDVTIPASNFTGGGVCKEDITRDVDVTAELGGDVYNLSARDGYTAPGYPDVSGFGSAMTGGTTNVVRVVSADDVESAKQKLLLRNTDQVRNQLQQQLKEANLFPLPTTFTSASSEPVSAPAVNEQGDSATVTMEFTYTMLGVPEADFTKLLSKSQEGKIDTDKEKIYDTGTSKATMSVAEKRSPSDMTISYSGVALVGPILDADAIARDIAGKRGGETKQLIEARPGIVSADVRYSPFYVFTTPDRLNRIQITFQVDGEDVQ